MANVKISELAAAGALDGTELIETVQGGVNKQTTTQDIADLGGGGLGYLVYTALLSQSGTDAPVATVLGNTLGGAVVWTRDNAGLYTGTANGLFPTNKTVFPNHFNYNGGATTYLPIADGSAILGYYQIAEGGDNNIIYMEVYNADFSARVDMNTLVNGSSLFIECRVYP